MGWQLKEDENILSVLNEEDKRAIQLLNQIATGNHGLRSLRGDDAKVFLNFSSLVSATMSSSMWLLMNGPSRF